MTMTQHQTATREEWRAARLKLLAAEKDLTRRSDALSELRQSLPWVRVTREYRFDTAAGVASLKDLFRGRSQLLVYHFMFGPTYTQGCPSCSAIADGFDGIAVHLANHDVTLMAVSRAPVAKLLQYPCRSRKSSRRPARSNTTSSATATQWTRPRRRRRSSWTSRAASASTWRPTRATVPA
jgi:predicted dithiol-disulfide oxidoreductase (DUF899 family)